MDIIHGFGPCVAGSSPAGDTRKRESGHGLMVEHLPSKQDMGVRFSLPAQKDSLFVDKSVYTVYKRQIG